MSNEQQNKEKTILARILAFLFILLMQGQGGHYRDFAEFKKVMLMSLAGVFIIMIVALLYLNLA